MNVSILQASFSKYDIRANIKFHILLHKNSTEICDIIHAALGNNFLSYENNWEMEQADCGWQGRLG